MTKIKICGLTNYEDSEVALNYGASYLGFIQYNKSPRYILFEEVKNIVSNLKKHKNNNFKIVGVFVNEKIENLIKIFDENIFDIFQLHGDEDSEYINKLNIQNIWKAIRIKNDEQPKIINFQNISKYLFDTYKENIYGGTGEVFNWNTINNIPKNKIILSGGLGLKNIKDALKKNFFAIDINSMVEIYPGKKDHQKIKELFDLIKEIRNEHT